MKYDIAIFLWGRMTQVGVLIRSGCVNKSARNREMKLIEIFGRLYVNLRCMQLCFDSIRSLSIIQYFGGINIYVMVSFKYFTCLMDKALKLFRRTRY